MEETEFGLSLAGRGGCQLGRKAFQHKGNNQRHTAGNKLAGEEEMLIHTESFSS